MMKKLLRAFEEKDFNLVNLLVTQKTIDPNGIIQDKGVSPFHLVIGNQSENFAFKVTKLFLRVGGDPNLPSTDGVTPVHVAAAWGRTRILHLLLVNGGDPWIQDDDRKNAFNYAFEEQEWETVELLHHFQLMHSAANWKRDFDNTPKFRLDFERVLLRNGGDMFAYLPDEKLTRSSTTQTQSFDSFPKPETPVQEMIKYYESNPPQFVTLDDSTCKKPDKEVGPKDGWCKDIFQASCEVTVHCDNQKSNECKPTETNSNQKKPSYVSSVHIDMSGSKSRSAIELSPDVDNRKQKPIHNPPPDVSDQRSKLLLELKQYVLKRSQARQKKELENSCDKSDNDLLLDTTVGANVTSISGIEPLNVSREENHSGKVACLFETKKKRSDKVEKVTNEIRVWEPENENDKTIDLCSSSPALTSTFLTCDDDEGGNNRNSFIHPESNSPQNCSNITFNDSNDSFVSLSEEYRYTDVEEGVVLMEKKLLINPNISLIADEEECLTDASSIASSISSLPSTVSYGSDNLRFELTSFGFNPGPITKTTKRLYLKKLLRLKKHQNQNDKPKVSFEKPKHFPVYSLELEKTLKNVSFMEEIPSFFDLEDEMCVSFDGNQTKRKWREGNSKTSFNYLLLDARISRNLPRRATGLSTSEIWECFISSIFYVGKGKRTRPYAHLYEAATAWNKPQTKKVEGKVQHILDIWKSDLGVICLHVFLNIIPAEAYTREAAMIDAIGLPNLKNIRPGEYYGRASTWKNSDKNSLGVYLLYKAMLILLSEGERQIRPFDID